MHVTISTYSIGIPHCSFDKNLINIDNILYYITDMADYRKHSMWYNHYPGYNLFQDYLKVREGTGDYFKHV